jgi:uncharacterized membrane protein YkvA (DUF1232 family)
MRRLMLLFWRVSRTDLRFLWFALRHPARPGWLLPIAIGLGLYALSPLNFAVPLVGVMDDLVIVPLALHWLLTLLPPALRVDFEQGSPAPRRAARDMGRSV